MKITTASDYGNIYNFVSVERHIIRLLFVRANILTLYTMDRENEYISPVTTSMKQDVCVTPFC